MARVKQEVIKVTQELISNLPPEHVTTCGLCNRTLFDNLSVIANKTGAPEKTVAYQFADQYNEGKHEEDQVTGNAFYERLKYIHRVNEKDLKSESHPKKPTIKEDEPGDVEMVSENDSVAQDLKSESGLINSPSVSTEEDEYCVDLEQTLPLDLNQKQLVYMLSKFFTDRLLPPDKIYRTFLNTMQEINPYEAELMRKGNKVLLEDLPKVIGRAIQNTSPDVSKISEIILEGLTDHSKLIPYSIRDAVQLMHTEVCKGDTGETQV